MPEWQPPWPPIRVGEGEWIIMRESKRDPAGVIRALRLGPRREIFYRVVTWAPTSEGRDLMGYYRTLHEADQSILFSAARKVRGPAAQAGGTEVSIRAPARPGAPERPRQPENGSVGAPNHPAQRVGPTVKTAAQPVGPTGKPAVPDRTERD